jgi:hypothetical protein
VLVTVGDRLKEVSQDLEIHCAWTKIKSKSNATSTKKSYRHKLGESVWRGFNAFLAVTQDDDREFLSSKLIAQLHDNFDTYMSCYIHEIKILINTVKYGTQNAIITDTGADIINIPLDSLSPESTVRDFLLQVVEQANNLKFALNSLSKDVFLSSGASTDKKYFGFEGDTFLFGMDIVVRRLINDLLENNKTLDEAKEYWKAEANAEGQRIKNIIIDNASPRSIIGTIDQNRPINLILAVKTFYFKVDRILDLKGHSYAK